VKLHSNKIVPTDDSRDFSAMLCAGKSFGSVVDDEVVRMHEIAVLSSSYAGKERMIVLDI
jgi:hypothetical protein